MAGNLNAGGQCLRFLFIGWNILVFLIGAGAVGVGAWQIAEGNDYEFLTEERYASGAIVSIVAGVIVMAVAFLGIVGGIALWRWALVLYALIVAIFIILEVTSGILGFVFRDEVEDKVGENALDAIQQFGNESAEDATAVINRVQENFECCGWNNYTDWLDTSFFNDSSMFPMSCECDENGDGDGSGDECGIPGDSSTMMFNQTIYLTSCRDSVIDFFEEFQLVLGAVGIAFAILQVSALVIALTLCFCVHRSNKEYTTV